MMENLTCQYCQHDIDENSGYACETCLDSAVEVASKDYIAIKKQNDKMRRIIESLWSLLDNIDALDESCGENDKDFRDQTRRQQQRRWETGIITDGYDLDIEGALDMPPDRVVVTEVRDEVFEPPSHGYKENIKIRVNAEIFDDPEWCEDGEGTCPNISRNGLCNVFHAEILKHKELFKKCDECKKAYKNIAIGKIMEVIKDFVSQPLDDE